VAVKDINFSAELEGIRGTGLGHVGERPGLEKASKSEMLDRSLVAINGGGDIWDKFDDVNVSIGALVKVAASRPESSALESFGPHD